MNYEKSCGGVVYRKNNEFIEYLLILNKKGTANGHWGFPKGHVENNESEVETARREILEEAGIHVNIDSNFREMTTYSPRLNVMKDVIYFAAECLSENITLQASEVADFMWCDYKKAMKILVNDKDILKKANYYLVNK